jgi:hypothetical protein
MIYNSVIFTYYYKLIQCLTSSKNKTPGVTNVRILKDWMNVVECKAIEVLII